jgi:hypothetical protein
MGLDIVGFSRAKKVVGRHPVEVCDDDEHYDVGSLRKRLDGEKTGCYLKTGRSFYFGLPYAVFGSWRDELCRVVLGVPADEVWERPARFRRQPFFELIDFPDCSGTAIGPKTSTKLFQDFAEWASKAKRGFQELEAQRRKLAAAKKTKKKRKATKISENNRGMANAQELAAALGAVLVGGEDSLDWQDNWEIYRQFRRAFKLASDHGFVLG